MKLISVYINAYNAEKYIAKTIQSVLDQTYKNIQLVVVDDGSTDTTPQIIKSFDDDRIEHYRVEPNGHIANALNVGLSHLKGEYFAHIDADDLWDKDKLQKQFDFLEQNPEYGACFTKVNLVKEDGVTPFTEDRVICELFELENIPRAQMFRYFYDNSNHLCHSSFFARKEIVKKLGNYDVSLMMLHDFDYWLRLLCVSPVYVMQERLVNYVVHEGSNSHMDKPKWNAHYNEYARIIKKAFNLLPDELFLEAFEDRLKLKGEHTHDEVEIEKAFVLADGIMGLRPNYVLAINRFAELFADEKYVSLAKEKFNFTIHDYYDMQKGNVFYDNGLERKLKEEIETITNEKDEIIAGKDEIIFNKEAAVSKLNIELSQTKQELLDIQNSFFWRLTKPPRAVIQAIKLYLFRHPRIHALFVYTKTLLLHGNKQAMEMYRGFVPMKPKKAKIAHTITKQVREEQEAYRFGRDIKFSVLVPLYNTPKNFLLHMIRSVQEQTYKNWELCLADGSDDAHAFVGEICKKLAAADSRIVYKKLDENKGISENTNECIKMSSGDYIALFDHDDVLHPSALFEVMKAVCEKNADYVYTDEATFLGTDMDNIITCHFKPDFAEYNLLANNYICHFSVFDRKLIDKVGMFRHDYDGSQDHDMILRLTGAAQNVVHIPKLLYFWRSHANSVAMDINSKTYAIEAGKSAVHDYLLSKGREAVVTSSPAFPTIYKIDYKISGNPKVSIIIPTKNHKEDLQRCVGSILQESTYGNFEIVIVDNNSDEQEIFDYYENLKADARIKVLHYDKPFNYSAINNFAAKNCDGDYLLLLNNDTQVITKNWIEELLMYAQLDDVGAVGAKLYYGDNTVQHGGVILGLGDDRIAGHAHHLVEKGNLGYMGKLYYAQNVSAVTAACMMIRRSVYDEINGFDEDMAVAYNDIDLCIRITQKGYNIVFNPFCELYHYESRSRGSDKTCENRDRFLSEKEFFNKKWGALIAKGDPYYNPNFSYNSSYLIK